MWAVDYGVSATKLFEDTWGMGHQSEHDPSCPFGVSRLSLRTKCFHASLVPRRSPPAHSTRHGANCCGVTEWGSRRTRSRGMPFVKVPKFHAKSCEREEKAWVLCRFRGAFFCRPKVYLSPQLSHGKKSEKPFLRAERSMETLPRMLVSRVKSSFSQFEYLYLNLLWQGS